MAEYIDREAAKEAICLTILHDGIRDALKCNIDDIPAADVVEVVRCRECDNWDTYWVPSHAGKGQYFCPLLGQVTDTDFYCGCGERKDGGQDDA